MMKIMYRERVAIYTGFRPTVSEIGPANNAPTPNPIRKSPVAKDSVTSPTPNSAVACLRAAESTLDANPTIQPIAAIFTLQQVSD